MHKEPVRIIISTFCILALFLCACGDTHINELDDTKVYNTRVNLMSNPLNVNVDSVHFSWSVDSSIYNQKGYSIVLYDSYDAAIRGRMIYEQSGEGNNASGISIDYELLHNHVYYYKIGVQTDSEIYYSELNYFVTEKDDYKNRGLTWASNDDNEHNVMLVKMPKVTNNIDKIVLQATGIGNALTKQHIFDIFIDGEYIGNGPTLPCNSSIYSQSWDITDYYHGGGILTFVNYAEGDHKGIQFSVTVYYKNGVSDELINSTDDASHIYYIDSDQLYGESIGTGYFVTDAEMLDAMVINGWDFSNQDFSKLNQVEKINLPEDINIISYASENVYRFQTQAEEIKILSNGNYFCDIGHEIIGNVGLTINSPKDAYISLYFGEELNEDGTVRYVMRTGNNYKYVWHLKKGNNSLQGLNVLGFRYLEIEGLPISLDAANLEFYELRQPFDRNQSYFECDNTILNDIYNICRESVIMTNQSILVDSQTRERAPYEGDAFVNILSSYSISNNYSLPRLTEEWLVESSTWPFEYIMLIPIMLYNDYLYTGDSSALERVYPIISDPSFKYGLFSDWLDQNIGLIEDKRDDSGYYRPLIDWPETEREDFQEAKYNTIENAFAYAGYDAMSKIAVVVNQNPEKWEQLKCTIKNNVISKLYCSDDGKFADGMDGNSDCDLTDSKTYHTDVFVLWSGIIDDNVSIKKNCLEYLATLGDNCFSIYGTYYLLNVLCSNEMGNQAYNILTETNTRSWAHTIYDLKATITTEAWDPVYKDNMTYSHAWGTGALSNIVTGLFGFQPTSPGFYNYRVIYNPQVISCATVAVPTARGQLCMNSEEIDDEIVITIDAPGNTTGEFTIPYGYQLIQTDIKTDSNADKSNVVIIYPGNTVMKLQKIMER